MLNFSEALTAITYGKKITRKGWNGPNQYVYLVSNAVQDGFGFDTFAVLKNAQGGRVPWLPSQGDLFAADWVEVE